MGKICSCNDLNNENIQEFFGFNNKYNNNGFIVKKMFNNYQEKDQIFYGKTDEYDKNIKDKLNDENNKDDEPKEYMNGNVKIIRI